VPGRSDVSSSSRVETTVPSCQGWSRVQEFDGLLLVFIELDPGPKSSLKVRVNVEACGAKKMRRA